MGGAHVLKLQLYTRPGCHLCEKMAGALLALPGTPAFELEEIDIDTDPGLQARYGGRIPVLVHEGVILCEYFLDEDRVKRFLDPG